MCRACHANAPLRNEMNDLKRPEWTKAFWMWFFISFVILVLTRRLGDSVQYLLIPKLCCYFHSTHSFVFSYPNRHIDYASLYHTILCYAILYYTILYHTMLYYTILHHTIPCYAILCHNMLYYAILYDAMRCYAMLCCATLCYTIP